MDKRMHNDQKVQLVQELSRSGIAVSSDAVDIARHMRDHSGLPTENIVACAVVYPKSAEQVSKVLRLCSDAVLGVVPQGGLTGMVGGALPGPDCVILSMERMREIEEVDLAASTMTVQAGVPLEIVQKRAAELGLLFPLDLGSRGSALIGGNIATNAGGNRVLRYGMMRDLVLGLEVVLPDGKIISSLNKMLKNNTGYDLKHFFIGSEGTLGVITRAVLRLWPLSRRTSVALCGVQSYVQVLEMLTEAREQLGGALSAFEVMWKEFYSVVVEAGARAKPLSPGYEFYVLIEGQGVDQADEDRFNRFIELIYEKGIIRDAAVAQSISDANAIWEIRDSSGELDRLFGKAYNFDISIPTGDIEKFALDCRVRVRDAVPGAVMLVFGHIADSNIHISCRAPDMVVAGKAIEETIYGCVRDWKGAVSAEHGIGLSKKDYLKFSRSAAEISLMKLIKSALDPQNILNPGKVLPD